MLVWPRAAPAVTMKATTGFTASLFAFDLVWLLETVVTGGRAARAEIQHRQTGPWAGLTLAKVGLECTAIFYFCFSRTPEECLYKYFLIK